MDDLDSVFSDVELPAIEAVAPEPEIVVEQVAEVQPEPSPEVAAPVEPEKRTDDHVPLAKYLDQRDELKELRRWKQEQEARAQQPRQPAPDLYDMKPEEVAAYVEQIAEQKAMANRFEMSDVIAKREYGAETVQTATEWAMERAKADPAFAAAYMREAHPIDFIVRQHRRDGIVSKLPEDVSSLDELIEREIAKRASAAPQVAMGAPVSQQSATTPKAPPKSLVNAPAHGGVSEVPTGKLAGLDAVFPG